MASDQEGPPVETVQIGAVEEGSHRRRTTQIAFASLAVGVILGSTATLAFAPSSSHVVSTGADRPTSTLQGLVEGNEPGPVPSLTSTETTIPALIPSAPTPMPPIAIPPGEPPGAAPGETPPAMEAPPPSLGQAPASRLPPARQRFVATLEAEPGWAPTDHFAATITVVEAHDGSWHAEVLAEGLQPRHRHGAGVTWEPPFYSGFCVGMSDDAGRWTCTAALDMQHVSPGATLRSGDLGEGSGRIWAHGPMRPA